MIDFLHGLLESPCFTLHRWQGDLLSLWSQKQALIVVTLASTKAASTLHFTQPMRGFSHLSEVGGAESYFSSFFRWWTTNQSFHTSYAILPTWFAKLRLSFQTTSFQWYQMLKKHCKSTYRRTSSFRHITNTLSSAQDLADTC
jgi:hypothetical protein